MSDCIVTTNNSIVPNHSKTIIALDFLRAFAAIIVVFGHVRTALFVPWYMLDPNYKGLLSSAFYLLTRMSHEAVLVFFVLSGFLVGGPLIQRVQANIFKPKEYFIDRLCRIYVPLIPACIFAGVVGYLLMGHIDDPLNILASSLGINEIVVPTTNLNPPLWSVSFEIWFYILAGFLAMIFIKKSPIIGFLGLLISALVFSKLDSLFILFWVFGAISYTLRDVLAGKKWFFVGLFTAFVFSAVFELNKEAGEVLNKSQVIYAQVFICFGISLALPWLCLDRVNNKFFIFEAFSKYLSSFSYTLYLFHYPIILISMSYLRKISSVTFFDFVFYVIFTVLVIVATIPFYWLFERNTGYIRKRLKKLVRVDKVGSQLI